MTIFQLLKTDHRKVFAIIKNIEQAENAPRRKEKLFQQLFKELSLHSKTEHLAVYRKLKEQDDARGLTLEAVEEHGLVDHLLSELRALATSDEKWDAKLTVLKEVLEHHIQEEESHMFEKLRKDFTPSELRAMADEMLAAKKNPAMTAVRTVIESVGEKVGLGGKKKKKPSSGRPQLAFQT